jgi:hypothetical protein
MVSTQRLADVATGPRHFHKLRMDIAAAFETLLEKQNLLISDRLAILGNITQYPYRINTNLVVKRRLSFTACILAIALYNGDLSPLFSSEKRPSAFGASGASSSTPLASWIPFGNSAIDFLLLRGAIPRGQPMTGDKCLVIGGKALVNGLLWNIKPFQGCASLRSTICDFQKLTDNTSKLTKPEQKHILLQLLVRQLYASNRTDLLELIIASALSRQFKSPAEIFFILKKLQEWVESGHENSKWPQQIFDEQPLEQFLPNAYVEDLPTPSRSQNMPRIAMLMSPKPLVVHDEDATPAKEKNSNIPLEWGDDTLRLVYSAISSDIPLAVGSCENGDETSRETLVSIFTVDPAECSLIFTPLSELEYEFGDRGRMTFFRTHRLNWCVNICNSGGLPPSETKKAREMLSDEPGGKADVSEVVLQVERQCSGVWSPRLSRNGLLKLEAEREAWKTVSLGRGKWRLLNVVDFGVNLYFSSTIFLDSLRKQEDCAQAVAFLGQ